MALNTGTLISAAIRPVDSLDPIASAYATEIKGGLHAATDSVDRDSIIFERREWGMMCYVRNLNKTYQLKYNYVSTDIMNNSNWVEFSGSGSGGGGTEWLDSVLSVLSSQPSSPSNGQRYLISSSPSGVVWSLYPDYVTEWNSTTSNWTMTQPKDGMSVRVDNEDEAIYKYEGNYPSGVWQKERVGQIRAIQPTTPNGLSYSVSTNPQFSGYVQDMMFLTKFSSTNIGATVSLNINSLGHKLVKKPSPSGLKNFLPGELETDVVYNLTYDGTYFQLNRPYTNDDIFSVKYYVESTDYIVVPQNYQYWVYSDLEIAGTLVNYGQVIICNGSLILSGGTFSNYGSLALINLDLGSTFSFNDSSTIDFTQVNTIYGLSASAEVKDGSLTASKLDTGSNGGATAGYFLSVDSYGDFIWSDSAVTPGDGLIKIGTDLAVNTGTGLTISSDQVILTDTGATAGSYGSSMSIPVLTIDSQGRITDAYTASVKTSDIFSVDNGLSIVSNNVVFGGTLSQNTTLDGDGYNLLFTNVDVLLFTSSTFDVEADGFISLDAGTGSIQLIANSDITMASLGGSIDLAANSGTVTTLNNEGLVYSGSYSSTFVTHSLVDKFYVDQSVSNLGSGTIMGVTAGNGLSGGGTANYISLDVNLGVDSGLTFSGDDIVVDINIAGNGLDFLNGVITVNTSEITNDLAGDGLVANGVALDVNVNSDSLEIISDIVRLKDIIAGDRTFQDSVTVNGNLTINGTTSYVYTENLLVEDNIITLNATWSGYPILNAGVEVNRGNETNASLIWNESTDLWSAGLSGSEISILLNSGTGLVKNGSTVSLDFNSITGTGLTQNGSIISIDTNGFATYLAGDGLSATGGTLSVNLDTNSGLYFIGDNIAINSGTTASGLTFSSGELSVVVDNSTIILNNLGQLESVAGSSIPVYQKSSSLLTNGNTSSTGITLTSTPNDYSRVQVFVNGQLQYLGNGVNNTDCYFSNDGGVTPLSISSLSIGDTLYWNGIISKFELDSTDVVSIIYES